MAQWFTPDTDTLIQLQQWFNTGDEARRWGGPHIHFPFTNAQFADDVKIAELASHALVEEGKLLAFGQYYLRLGHCHLGRLAVSPEVRGRGLGYKLVQHLMQTGTAELKVSGCSLFVYEDNQAAINLYHKCGFTVAEYPEAMPLQHCLYMRAD